MEVSDKIKMSAGFTVTKLICIVGCVLSISQYLEERKIYGLYTELWLLSSIFSLIMFVYFFTRPKVYFDSSSLYFKRFNKSEIRVPLKNIHSIFNNLFFRGRGIRFYEIEYLDEKNEIEKNKFQSDSLSVMQDFKNLVRKFNQLVEIV